MTKRILAPIGAEERSEAVVPLVAALARESGATVRLLRVFPVPERIVGAHGRTVAYVDQEMARLTSEGLDDLARPAGERPGARRGRARRRQGDDPRGRAARLTRRAARGPGQPEREEHVA